MRVRCPHCNSEAEVAEATTEVVCTSCQQSFGLLAEAETLTEPVSPHDAPPDAPSATRPRFRVNCFRCKAEFTIPLGQTGATCPRCGAPFSIAQKEAPPTGLPGSVRTAKTVVTGEAPSAKAEAPAGDEATLRWMRAQFEGRYEVLGFLSRGGMGAVYKARQKQPDREVALKVMLAGTLTSSPHRKRFEREAQAVANLRHAAIVPVYECGEVAGQPYFTMELVDGMSLKQYILQHQLSREETCRLMVRVCDAIHYAHQHGVVHRDLKPGNIMVDSLRRPRILDFGLSRVSVQGDEPLTALTMTGDFMGTPHYMSPEQASGRPRGIDERTDVYSLGVILYELTVGILPYPIEHARGVQALDVVRTARPIPPRALHPDMPYDLELIILKAIEKDRDQRYQTAEALAQELESFLSGRPITARPATITYRLDRWAWRNRRVVVPLALASLVAVVLVALIWHRFRALRRSSQELQQQVAKYERYLERAESAAAAVEEFVQKGLWRDALDLARFARRIFPEDADTDYLEAKVRHRAERRLRDRLAAFDSALKKQDYDGARREASSLMALAAAMPYEDLMKRAAEVEPGFDERCWADLQRGALAAYRPEDAAERIGAFLERLPGNPHSAEAMQLRDRLAAEPSEYFLRQHERAFAEAMLAREWAEADRVFQSAEAILSSQVQAVLHGWQDAVTEQRRQLSLVIRTETAGNLRILRILETPDRPQAGGWSTRFVKSLAFSPDSSYLAVGADNGTLTWWRTSDGTLIHTFEAEASVRSVAISPDGKLLAAGLSDGQVVVVSADNLAPHHQWRMESSNNVTSMAFSPDGRLLLSANVGAIGLWDVQSGQALGLKRVAGQSPAALSPDGRLLAAASREGPVRLWELSAEYVQHELTAASEPVKMTFSPDGSLLAVLYEDETVRLWDVESGSLAGTKAAGKRRLCAAAFSCDGRLLATGGADEVATLWDVQSLVPLTDLHGHTGWMTALAFSTNGLLLATGGNDSRALLWGLSLPDDPALPNPSRLQTAMP